ncbi:peptidase associated/transthyretin-like domain-containing protein [Aureivirga marina]|uniref:hypothetical protein n=1 Tax=Aureivirga marina TaxID=1182451 RepID=UPI0018CB13E6|nr:hypothetical protein [Aureivirga marina]
MKIKLLFILFFAGIGNMISQEIPQDISQDFYQGYVKDGETFLSNIHIVNKTKKRVTLSNEEGYFKILCDVGDILVFSAVNYRLKEIKVGEEFNTYQIHYITLDNTIELEEVEIRNHGLTGNLSEDASNVPESDLSKINPIALDFSSAYMDLGYEINNSQGPPKAETDPTKRVSGVNMLGLAAFMLTPIIDAVGPSDLHSRVLQKEERRRREYQELLKTLPEVLVKNYGKSMFVNRLEIPEHKIEDFIKYCYKDNIVRLYQDEKHLEIMEIFLENKIAFLDQ